MIPAKLKPGDEIRVVAPAHSLSSISSENREIAIRRLEEMGFRVTFSSHAQETDAFGSASVSARIADLHEAFADLNVKAVLTAIGGFNSNQLLRRLDYSLIRSNPKILCGYSDITALQNAILAKTGLVTYSGPHFSTFAMIHGLEYTVEHFRKCLMETGEYEVKPSPVWSDDPWYRDQENREWIPSEGWWVLQEGEAEGTVLGGNLCTFNLLHGTEFMPDLSGAILFVEDDDLVFPEIFDRDLQSLLHQPGFEGVRGLVIGRFQKKSRMTLETLRQIISSKPELKGIPVIANLDFGHTVPQLTFPIGGKVRLRAEGKKASILIVEH
jgi:muramoyltetrapeptide carboxypeptidase LdcA involved in peptidoglycan recycling